MNQIDEQIAIMNKMEEEAKLAGATCVCPVSPNAIIAGLRAINQNSVSSHRVEKRFFTSSLSDAKEWCNNQINDETSYTSEQIKTLPEPRK